MSTDEGMSERCFLLEYLDHSHFSRNQAITQYKCLELLAYEEEKEVSGIYLRV